MILFSALTVGSMGVKTAFDAMSKVTASAYMAEALQEVVEKVKSELVKGNTHGDGKLDKIISFSFKAEKIDSGKNISQGATLVSTGIMHGSFTLSLYGVELLLNARVHGRNTEREYDYKELIWKKDTL